MGKAISDTFNRMKVLCEKGEALSLSKEETEEIRDLCDEIHKLCTQALTIWED